MSIKKLSVKKVKMVKGGAGAASCTYSSAQQIQQHGVCYNGRWGTGNM